MTRKQVLIISLVCISFFILGFFSKSLLTTSENIKVITLSDTSVVSLPVESVIDSSEIQKQTPFTKEVNYENALKGKFVLADADYAGFDFIDSKMISWTNEILPQFPDTMRLKWLSENIFVTTFTKLMDKDCPPRNWECKVLFYDGNKLLIKHYWTGWEESSDWVDTLYKSAY